MHYGTVINGGAQMRKGVTKEINDKHDGFGEKHVRGEKIAKAVEDIYKVNTLSEQHTDDIRQFGKFKKPKQAKNV